MLDVHARRCVFLFALFVHSMVAKLLYLTMKVRPELLTAISYLCSRVSSATTDDKIKLIRVLKYLKGTINLGLTFKKSTNFTAISYVDASFGIHSDGTSRSGACELLGGNFIICRSRKQKLVSLHSCESELYALSEQLVEILWYKKIIKGGNIDPCS